MNEDENGWRPDMFGGNDDDFGETLVKDEEPSTEWKATIVEISKVTIEEGEILLVKVPKDWPARQVQGLAETLSKVFGDKADQIAIVSKEVDFEKADIKASSLHPLY